MKSTIKINGNLLKFCNFFKDKDGDRNKVDMLECELDLEYSKYSLNSFEGIQNRMNYAASNGIIYAQLGNTTTYLYVNKNASTIYGLDSSINEIFEESKNVGLEQACEDFLDSVGYYDSEYTDREWYPSWKKGIEEFIEFAKTHHNKLNYYGCICNEMWRIMAAEPETIIKNNLINDFYNDFVDVPAKPGIWELETDYSDNNPVYFKMIFKGI